MKRSSKRLITDHLSVEQIQSLIFWRLKFKGVNKADLRRDASQDVWLELLRPDKTTRIKPFDKAKGKPSTYICRVVDLVLRRNATIYCQRREVETAWQAGEVWHDPGIGTFQPKPRRASCIMGQKKY